MEEKELFIKEGLSGKATMLYTALRDAGHIRALVPQVKVASAGR